MVQRPIRRADEPGVGGISALPRRPARRLVGAGRHRAGDIVAANLDQSAAFLDPPRAHTLFIINYPDQSEYSPLFHGDSFYRLWYQFTQISDKIKRRLPAGQINANDATANVYGTVIRDSAVCAGGA